MLAERDEATVENGTVLLGTLDELDIPRDTSPHPVRPLSGMLGVAVASINDLIVIASSGRLRDRIAANGARDEAGRLSAARFEALAGGFDALLAGGGRLLSARLFTRQVPALTGNPALPPHRGAALADVDLANGKSGVAVVMVHPCGSPVREAAEAMSRAADRVPSWASAAGWSGGGFRANWGEPTIVTTDDSERDLERDDALCAAAMAFEIPVQKDVRGPTELLRMAVSRNESILLGTATVD